MRSVEWWHCRWSWMTLTTLNHTFLRFGPSFISLEWVKLESSNSAHGKPCQVLALGWQTTAKWAWSRSRDQCLNFGTPIVSLKRVNFQNWCSDWPWRVVAQASERGCVFWVTDLFNFWQICESIPGTIHGRDIRLQWKTNRKSYVTHRMVSLLMTLSHVEGRLSKTATSLL